jgi:hypothetical protein
MRQRLTKLRGCLLRKASTRITSLSSADTGMRSSGRKSSLQLRKRETEHNERPSLARVFFSSRSGETTELSPGCVEADGDAGDEEVSNQRRLCDAGVSQTPSTKSGACQKPNWKPMMTFWAVQLNERNYTTWPIRIQIALSKAGCKKIVLGKETSFFARDVCPIPHLLSHRGEREPPHSPTRHHLPYQPHPYPNLSGRQSIGRGRRHARRQGIGKMPRVREEGRDTSSRNAGRPTEMTLSKQARATTAERTRGKRRTTQRLPKGTTGASPSRTSRTEIASRKTTRQPPSSHQQTDGSSTAERAATSSATSQSS